MVSVSASDEAARPRNQLLATMSASDLGCLANLYMSGACVVQRLAAAHGVWLRTRLRLSLEDGQGYSQLLYDSLPSLNTDDWEGDELHEATLPINASCSISSAATKRSA